MIMTDQSEAFYNDLALSLSRARDMVIVGTKDRRSAAHTPVVASVDAAGRPSQRVMILRAVDWPQRLLRFHTDLRSAKTSEMDEAAASVLIYDADAKIQLRLSGHGRIESVSGAAEAAWEGSTLFARRCYMAEAAPGQAIAHPSSGLPHWIEGKQPSDAEIAPARGNFAILLIQFDMIEWLFLANQGHRRTRWQWDETAAQWQGSWLIP